MLTITRLSHVAVSTEDFEAQSDYYVRVLGLRLMDRAPRRQIFSSMFGLPAIELEAGNAGDLRRMSFHVAPDVELEAIARYLNESGITSDVRSDAVPTIGKMLSLQDPDGTKIDLFQDCSYVKPVPYYRPFDILKLGHVAARVSDVNRTVKFYCDVLGFKVSDWLTEARVFLRCNSDHHSLNFAMERGKRLHHIAFEVQDWSELKRSIDRLAENAQLLDWGPGRHMVGHNVACYHRNSDAVRVEIFTEMDQIKNESLGYFDPRPWHQHFPAFPTTHPYETLRNYWGVGNERDPQKTR